MAVALRPRDAAAIVLVDRSAAIPKVLMGKRSSRHVFMPETYVFPGGKRDAGDHTLAYAQDLRADVLERLTIGPPARFSTRRARALALAALRELGEETSLASPCAPDLSTLHFVARAITPPGYPRRYDTRFFLLFTDESGLDLRTMRTSEELCDLRWLDTGGDPHLNIPDITRSVLRDVKTFLQTPSIHARAAPVPFYRTLRGRAIRSFL